MLITIEGLFSSRPQADTADAAALVRKQDFGLGMLRRCGLSMAAATDGPEHVLS
jgi:hypothetical protein